LSVQTIPKDTSMAPGIFFLSKCLSFVDLGILKAQPGLVQCATIRKRKVRTVLRFELKILLQYALEKIAVNRNLRHLQPPMLRAIQRGPRRDRSPGVRI
jgi:hypothetical protein